MGSIQINRGAIIHPQKVVLYGVEGVGKTTLAAQFPDPLFIDTEGGTEGYDVARTHRRGIRTRKGAELRKRASVFQRSTRGAKRRSGARAAPAARGHPSSPTTELLGPQ